MNILLLYANDPFTTGGSIPVDLLNKFKSRGHTVKLLVDYYQPNYPEDIVSAETKFGLRKKNFFKRVRRRWGIMQKGMGIKEAHPTDPKYHFFDLREKKTYYKTTTLLKRAEIKPDVIILFFLKGFINTKNIYELHKLTNAPVYWLLYDMAPITGGCHYAWDCKGYQQACGSCPGLYSTDPHDLTFDNLQYKKKYLDKTNLHVVTATEWQYRQAKESTLFKHQHIYKILTAFSEDIFKPVPKQALRESKGIGPDRKIIFFGAFRLNDERKGMTYLLEALNAVKAMLDPVTSQKVLLLVAGNGIDKIKDVLPFPYHNLGMLDNSYGIASAYQLADVFVCPSVEDSGPTMINQSIMCGTPVVSFEMGVSPDLVINGKTGYMARLKDSKDLAHGICTVLTASDSEHEGLSRNCRQLALEKFSLQGNIESWLNILNSTK